MLAGLFIGLAANVRPFTAVAVVSPFALYGVYRMVKEPGRLVPRFLLMVACAGGVASLTLVYNQLTNGDPLLFGYVVKWGKGHEIGFGKSGWGAQHTPIRGLFNTGNDTNLVNKFLYEWPLPAFLPILVLFAKGHEEVQGLAPRRGLPRPGRGVLFLLVPQYLLRATVRLRGIGRAGHPDGAGRRVARPAVAADFQGRRRRRPGEPVHRADVGGADRADARYGLRPLVRSYHHYGGVDGRVVRNVRKAGLKNALVFCYHFGNGYYENNLELDGDVVYAKDHGILNAALTIEYPDRQYFYANIDTLRPITGIRYPESRLKRALDEMATFLQDTMTLDYRSVIWPFIDIPVPDYRWDRNSHPTVPVLTDYRDVSRGIFSGEVPKEGPEAMLAEHLPALACWMIGDDREHLRIFSFMDDLQNFIAGRYKFTLLMVTAEGTGAIYDISETTGEEETLQDQPGAIPFR